MDNQPGPTVGTLLKIVWQPGWEGSFGGEMDTCICMAESLCYLPKTMTTWLIGYTLSSVQSLSCVRLLFVTLWTLAHQASLPFTISQSLLRLMSIESVIPSNHLILCHPLLLLPLIFSSIRLFSNESALRISMILTEI